MDELINSDLSAWRWQDATTVDWGLFWWMLLIAYLLVMMALVVRVILKVREVKEHKPTEMNETFNTYKPRRRIKID